MSPALLCSIGQLDSWRPRTRFAAAIDVTLLWRWPLLRMLFGAEPTKDVFEVAVPREDTGLLRTWDGRSFPALEMELTSEALRFITGLTKRNVLKAPLLSLATTLDGPFVVLDGTHRVFRWLGSDWKEPLRLGVVLVKSLEQWSLEGS